MSNDTDNIEIRLILGDQLNAYHSWYKSKNDQVIYVVAETLEEASYVPHHIQKVCGFFLAMKNFAAALQQAGHRVLHLTLDDTHQFPDFPSLLSNLLERYRASHFRFQHADEYRLQQKLVDWATNATVSWSCDSSEHFLLAQAELAEWLPNGKQWRMEYFYRKMRKKFQVLMEGDKPAGGQWNYDQENRHALPTAIDVPNPLQFGHNVEAIVDRLERHAVKTIGRVASSQFSWPANRRESKQLLSYFIQYLLPNFGTYQDAISQHHWSLFHSRISFSLNTKMLSPLDVIRAVETAYIDDEAVSLAQAEGFIRQILGWREFVRAIYWRSMPNYLQSNYFQTKRSLPDYFWTGDTKMACMQHAIGQSLEHAYAHHIQRLMITGNFCLLTGIDPIAVHEWYLSIYIDAIEWVEAPNTLGMSQFADGGKLASKPYAASGNYINKMSDHCKQCHYKVREKYGNQSCPFNSLYWEFLHRNENQLKTNHRLGLVYKNWEKRSPQEQDAILTTAKYHLDNIEEL